MESPQKPNEKFKFPSFEHFVVRTEQKENPRRMPYLSCSITSENHQIHLNNVLRGHLRRLLKDASIDKEVVDTEPNREFLKTVWQRDNYLYFNGVYFPNRWIDTKGRYRPEREAFVVKDFGIKPNIRSEMLYQRVFKDSEEWVFAAGEGGFYFPDHDNNILIISDAIIESRPSLKESLIIRRSLHPKIVDIHKKIFGEDILILILPSPDNASHLDTHLSVIPKTKIVLIENNYYEKLKQTTYLEQLAKLGYKSVQIPPTKMQCPLNILYLEDGQGRIWSFMSSKTPDLVKNTLRNNGIDICEADDAIADDLDNHLGGIRCITNELHTKDPAFLRKLGLKI